MTKKSFKNIIDKIGIDETFTKPVPKDKQYHHVKDNIPLKEDYNFSADLLFLPTTKNNYKYLLTMVDLATDECDFEPLKTKEPKEVLSAMKIIFSRPHLNKPYASLSTDAGNEFKGIFQKYLYDESIYQKVALKARHSQQANIEALNKQLGRLLNGYMNAKEKQTKKVYKEWVEVLPIIRTELNEFRKKSPKELLELEKNKPIPNLLIPPKYKIGDLVHRHLDYPENALGEKQSTANFRVGDVRWDTQPRKVEQVVILNAVGNPYRYIISGIPNASFTEKQLMLSKEEEELFEIKQILDKQKINGKTHYKVWYYGEKKKEASWQPESDLIKFVPDLVKSFNDALTKKNKK